MIAEGNYNPIDIKVLKHGLLATLRDMYGRSNPRIDDIVNNLDIFFYVDDDSLHEVVDTSFNTTKYKHIGKFIKKIPVSGSADKKELAMYSLIGADDDKKSLVLGDGCALNIAYNMLSVGPDIYLQDLDTEKRKKYIHALKSVLDALDLTGKPKTMQLIVLGKLNKARVNFVENCVMNQGKIGNDYLSMYYQNVAKSQEYIDYIRDIYYISERDRKIVEECGIDENVIENLSMVGIFYGTSLQTPGDILAFSKDADRRLQKGDLADVIYRKRVKVMEYINNLPARIPDDGETWETIYRDYVKKGYKKLDPEEVADLESYRKRLSAEIIASTSQIEDIIEKIESPMGDGGYVVPTTIDRTMFMQENTGFIPNAIVTKDGRLVKKGVIILDDNIHISRELALKYFLHEAGHAMISEIESIDDDGYVVIRDAMFGRFSHSSKAGLDDDGNVLDNYWEPINLIENINERKTVEMLMTYVHSLRQKNPFKEQKGVVYQYMNSYRVGNFITDSFYEKFGGIIDRDIAMGRYTLRDAVGKENIMELEKLLAEFNVSRVRRELFSAMLMGADKDYERFLKPDVRAEYDDFVRRAKAITQKMVKHNYRYNNPDREEM